MLSQNPYRLLARMLTFHSTHASTSLLTSETKLPTRLSRDMTVADALYRLETSKDIPDVKLSKFDGNPLKYVEFLETFKIHVHNKCHLTDDMRMVQMKTHVAGEAEKGISGLGCGGIMYATALKTLQEQFGQKSVIAGLS